MSEVNFRIIEGYEPVVDYEEFKKDFIDPNIRADDIREKYGLSLKRWIAYRKRVCDETGLARKPSKNNHFRVFKNCFPARVVPVKTGHEFIQEKNGSYCIIKTIGKRTYYFGRYITLDCAMKVRDKLVECNWDYETGKRLASKYGRDRLRPAKIKALKMYDEFEDLYINSNKLITTIQSELGLTNRMYMYLIEELYNRHGKMSRTKIRAVNGVEPIKDGE